MTSVKARHVHLCWLAGNTVWSHLRLVPMKSYTHFQRF